MVPMVLGEIIIGIAALGATHFLDVPCYVKLAILSTAATWSLVYGYHYQLRDHHNVNVDYCQPVQSTWVNGEIVRDCSDSD